VVFPPPLTLPPNLFPYDIITTPRNFPFPSLRHFSKFLEVVYSRVQVYQVRPLKRMAPLCPSLLPAGNSRFRKCPHPLSPFFLSLLPRLPPLLVEASFPKISPLFPSPPPFHSCCFLSAPLLSPDFFFFFSPFSEHPFFFLRPPAGPASVELGTLKALFPL